MTLTSLIQSTAADRIDYPKAAMAISTRWSNVLAVLDSRGYGPSSPKGGLAGLRFTDAH